MISATAWTPRHPKQRRGPYRRIGEYGPQVLAIKRLYALGWPDHRIADALCRLSPEALHRLTEASSEWDEDEVESLLSPHPDPTVRPWTTRQVYYWRRRLYKRLRGRRKTPDRVPLVHLRQAVWRAEQRAAGWGHLLPVYSDERGEWSEGLELTRTELRILTLLRVHGPLTRGQLLFWLDRLTFYSEGKSCMRRLLGYGMVRLTFWGQGLIRFHLSG